MWYSINASSSKLQEMKTIMEKESFGLNSQIRYHYKPISVWLQFGCLLTYLLVIKGADNNVTHSPAAGQRHLPHPGQCLRVATAEIMSWGWSREAFFCSLCEGQALDSTVLNCVCHTQSRFAISWLHTHICTCTCCFTIKGLMAAQLFIAR